MDAFATIDDLEARYKTLTESEEARATALLMDASVMLAGEFERVGKSIDTENDLLMANLVRVICAMVKRVLASGLEADISSSSMTAGSYSEQRTFANPTGDMYITKNERRSLGLPARKQRIGCIFPKCFKGE